MQTLAESSLTASQLLEQAREKAGESPQESLKLLDQVEELQKTKFHLPDALEAALIRCDYYLDNDDPREALAIADKWLDRSKEMKADQVFKVRLCRANALAKKDDSHLAESEYRHLLSSAQNHKNLEQEASVLLDYGKFLSFLGHYSDALAHLQAAQKSFADLGNENKGRITLNSIAILYGRIGEDKKSIEYFQEVLKQNRKLGKKRNEAVVLYNMGRRYEDLKDIDAALKSYHESLKIHKELKNVASEALLEKSLGGIYNLKKQPDKALAFLQRALKVFEEKGLVKNQAQVHLEIANAYRQLKLYPHATRALEKTEDLFGAQVSLSQKADLAEQQTLLFKEQGRWQEAYRKLTEFQKYSEEHILKQKEEQLLRQQLKFEIARKENDNLILRRENELKEQKLQDSNRIRALQVSVMALVAALCSLVGVFLIRQVRVARKMRTLAHTDELTKIANRRHVITYGEEMLKQCRELNLPFSVLLLDIDFFKKVNDNFGHAIGDIVLSKTAEICASVLRKGDCIGRFGGEEFLVILPASSPQQAAEIADRICTRVAVTTMSDIHANLRVTISIGAASDITSSKSLEELTAKADEALYHVKNNGRNGIKVVSVA
ncbi:diguanylate cyclase [Bdellovibrio sp. HCB337]|uniref:tetratricopeptide repeat-containing diguanylate cyclase n=1 Tax=Bdellovibrio sp. HCB337 TaxID=3394358 RepID=UPI0039A5CE75